MTDRSLFGRRVLIVEDESLMAILLEDMLAELGCEIVGVAGRLEDALHVIQSQTLDAVVLDVNLGGELSYPAADALMALGIPFTFSTGYDRLQNGYDSLPRLQKPYDMKRLEKMLTELFDR